MNLSAYSMEYVVRQAVHSAVMPSCGQYFGMPGFNGYETSS